MKVCLYIRGVHSDLGGVDSDWVELARDPERASSDMEQRVNFAGMCGGMTVEPARDLAESA